MTSTRVCRKDQTGLPELDRSNPEHAKLLDLHRATRYVAVESEDIFSLSKKLRARVG